MAHQGAKRRKDDNERRLRQLRLLILAANAAYLLLRCALLRASLSWRHLAGLVATSAAYAACYTQLAAIAAPAYDDRGELLDGGFDFALGGLPGYLLDVIYVTAFVQVSSIISDYFWLAYLVIPGFALYKLWQHVLHPYFFQPPPAEGPETELERKRRLKAERRAARPKFGRTSRR
eukprot:SM000112S24011  [mRNA]  locus=s112:435233:436362:- [translate_table: standard]